MAGARRIRTAVMAAAVGAVLPTAPAAAVPHATAATTLNAAPTAPAAALPLNAAPTTLTGTAAGGTAPAGSTAPQATTAGGRGRVLTITVAGNRFGKRVRIVVRGVKGPARGVTRTVRVAEHTKVRGLPRGSYRVLPRAVRSAGWTASTTQRYRVTLNRSHRRQEVDFTYRVVSTPRDNSTTAASPSGPAGQRQTWRQGWWWIDMNGDGRWDTAAEDPQGDGTTTNVWSDTNYDGYYDLHWWDATGEGQLDSLQLDPDFNGTLDAYLWDSTGDGRLDTGYSHATGGRPVSLTSAAGVNAALTTTSVNFLLSAHDHCVTMDWCNTGSSALFPQITPPSLLP